MLSVCILAKDASRSILDSLKSAANLGDEIIIHVDNSSSDDTLEIASNFAITDTYNSITIGDFDFNGFGQARDNLIRAAHGNWIFMLDSDEIVDEGDAFLIREQLKKGLKKAIYQFPRKNWLDFERTEFHSKFYPDYQNRLFPRMKKVNYGDQKVHEVVKGLPSLLFPVKDIHIHHFCFAYRTHEDWHRVNQFYKSLGSTLKDVET